MVETNLGLDIHAQLLRAKAIRCRTRGHASEATDVCTHSSGVETELLLVVHDCASNSMAQSLPAHLDMLSAAIDEHGLQRIDPTQSFAEALLKSLVSVLYSELLARDQEAAIHAAGGL